MSKDEQYIRVRDAANRLCVHENTVRNWVAIGILHDARIPGTRHTRLLASQVDTLAQRRQARQRLGEHDGWTVHPDVTPELFRLIRKMITELDVCLRDHPDDERLSRIEAGLRFLIGQRV